MSVTKTTLFSSVIGDIPVVLAFINNLSAATDPTTGDDTGDGYVAGSTWINTTAKRAFVCVDATLGAAVWNETGFSGTAGQVVAPAASTPTGAGSAAALIGGAGGSTSGSGGAAQVTGGAGTAGNANGGSAVIQGGAPNGTGVAGSVRELGLVLKAQGAPSAQTVSAVLTAAALLTGILTVNQGAAGASALQLPLATALDTAIPDAANNDAFDFSVINISTVAAESASLTTNTGWTLVGDMDVSANSAATTKSAGRFRARRTAAGAWTLYRLS